MELLRIRSLVLCAAVLSATLGLQGCENMESVGKLGVQIIDTAVQGDEEDARKWEAVKRTARAVTGDIDLAEEISMGESMSMAVFVQLGKPHPDAALQRYVSLVGRTVARYSERPGLPYWFAVIQNDQESVAVSLPGGYIIVTTGLLRKLKGENELACILAHEVAHVAQKHGLETTLRDTRFASLVELGAAFDPEAEEYSELVDIAFDTLVHKGYDQGYEIKADLAGTRYAYMAGYHPEGLLPFLQQSVESGVQFEFFETHPDPAKRITEIRKLLREFGQYGNMPTLSARYQREVLEKL